MSSRTYYNVLGVSREATPEEITNAKNALAKIYHPDANMHNDIDTTKEMQEILEAYRVLSDPEKRKVYDRKLGGGKARVFRTFTVGESKETDEQFSFVSCWNAAMKLQETVRRSSWLLGIQTEEYFRKDPGKAGKEQPPGEGAAHPDGRALPGGAGIYSGVKKRGDSCGLLERGSHELGAGSLGAQQKCELHYIVCAV